MRGDFWLSEGQTIVYCWYGIFNQRMFGKFSFNFVFFFLQTLSVLLICWYIAITGSGIVDNQISSSRNILSELRYFNSRRADYKCEPISSVSFFDNTAQLTAVNWVVCCCLDVRCLQIFHDLYRLIKFLISHPQLSLDSSRVILVCFQKFKKRQFLFIQMGHLFCLEVVRLIVVFVPRPLFSWELESEKWVNLCGEEKRKQILSSKRHCCKVLQDPLNTLFFSLTNFPC